MEPNYGSIDPEERTDKMMAALSFILGIISLAAGLIPICGAVVSLAGIGVGLFGRRSESRKLATAGIVICVFGFILSVVYAIFVQVQKK